MSKLGVLLLAASGCVTFDPIGLDETKTPPGDGGVPDSNLEARRAFKQDVHPILRAQCGACHSETGIAEPWFRDNPDEAYDTLTTTYVQLLGYPMFSENAPLITAPRRTSQAFYTAYQIERIFYWFGLETL